MFQLKQVFWLKSRSQKKKIDIIIKPLTPSLRSESKYIYLIHNLVIMTSLFVICQFIKIFFEIGNFLLHLWYIILWKSKKFQNKILTKINFLSKIFISKYFTPSADKKYTYMKIKHIIAKPKLPPYAKNFKYY